LITNLENILFTVYGENETFLLIETQLLHSGGDNGIPSE